MKRFILRFLFLVLIGITDILVGMISLITLTMFKPSWQLRVSMWYAMVMHRIEVRKNPLVYDEFEEVDEDYEDDDEHVGGMEMPPCDEHPWNDGVDDMKF